MDDAPLTESFAEAFLQPPGPTVEPSSQPMEVVPTVKAEPPSIDKAEPPSIVKAEPPSIVKAEPPWALKTLIDDGIDDYLMLDALDAASPPPSQTAPVVPIKKESSDPMLVDSKAQPSVEESKGEGFAPKKLFPVFPPSIAIPSEAIVAGIVRTTRSSTGRMTSHGHSTMIDDDESSGDDDLFEPMKSSPSEDEEELQEIDQREVMDITREAAADAASKETLPTEGASGAASKEASTTEGASKGLSCLTSAKVIPPKDPTRIYSTPHLRYNTQNGLVGAIVSQIGYLSTIVAETVCPFSPQWSASHAVRLLHDEEGSRVPLYTSRIRLMVTPVPITPFARSSRESLRRAQNIALPELNARSKPTDLDVVLAGLYVLPSQPDNTCYSISTFVSLNPNKIALESRDPATGLDPQDPARARQLRLDLAIWIEHVLKVDTMGFSKEFKRLVSALHIDSTNVPNKREALQTFVAQLRAGPVALTDNFLLCMAAWKETVMQELRYVAAGVAAEEPLTFAWRQDADAFHGVVCSSNELTFFPDGVANQRLPDASPGLGIHRMLHYTRRATAGHMGNSSVGHVEPVLPCPSVSVAVNHPLYLNEPVVHLPIVYDEDPQVFAVPSHTSCVYETGGRIISSRHIRVGSIFRLSNPSEGKQDLLYIAVACIIKFSQRAVAETITQYKKVRDEEESSAEDANAAGKLVAGLENFERMPNSAGSTHRMPVPTVCALSIGTNNYAQIRTQLRAVSSPQIEVFHFEECEPVVPEIDEVEQRQVFIAHEKPIVHKLEKKTVTGGERSLDLVPTLAPVPFTFSLAILEATARELIDQNKLRERAANQLRKGDESSLDTENVEGLFRLFTAHLAAQAQLPFDHLQPQRLRHIFLQSAAPRPWLHDLIEPLLHYDRRAVTDTPIGRAASPTSISTLSIRQTDFVTQAFLKAAQQLKEKQAKEALRVSLRFSWVRFELFVSIEAYSALALILLS